MPVNEISRSVGEPQPPAPRLNRICSMTEDLHQVITSVESRVESMCGGSRDAQKGSIAPVPDGLNAQIEQMLQGALTRMREIELRLLAEA